MKFARLLAALILVAVIGAVVRHAWSATTILPPGQTCFTIATGAVSNGSVNMFQVGTTSPKTTWRDANQTAANTQPIQLDGNGCAIIYGVGSYRQQLYDGPVVSGMTTGNLIFDLTTTDTSATNNSFWAGLAAGTPNAITVTDAGFNATDGSVIQFIPISTNSGATTLNPSGFGAIQIVKDTTTGAVGLTGGEIVANSPSNVVSVIYSASQANFHLLNLVSAANATTPQTLCGAIGLKIVNDTSTPTTKMDVTADQITMVTTGGQTISRSNVSFVLNFGINGANGLDTGSFAGPNWYYVYVIDNGSAPASLGSLQTATPSLPSGYSYRCRLGSVRADSTPNLMRTMQLGSHAQYVVTPATNTTSAVALINGVGTSTNCGTASPTYESVSLSTALPPTATWGDFILWGNYNASGSLALVLLAPNANYGGTGTATTNPAFTGEQNGSFGIPLNAHMMLETAQTAFYCGNGANSSLWLTGWTDKVNAN